MMKTTPEVLRDLLARYAALRFAVAERERPELRRALAEVTRALCDATRTDDTRAALAAADAELAENCCGAAVTAARGAA